MDKSKSFSHQKPSAQLNNPSNIPSSLEKVNSNSNNSRSNKSPGDLAFDEFDNIPDEETPIVLSPKHPKFKQKIGLTELQPKRHRMSLFERDRTTLIPLEMAKKFSRDYEQDLLQIVDTSNNEDTNHHVFTFTNEQADDFEREVLHGSLKGKQLCLRKNMSQDYSIRMVGSGIPMLDTQLIEVEEEKHWSSGNSQSNDEDDKISISKLERDFNQNDNEHEDLCFKLNRIGEGSDENMLQNALSFAEDINDYKQINTQEIKYQIQSENYQEDIFNYEKLNKDNDPGTPKFGDAKKFQTFKFIFRNEQQRIKYLRDLNQALQIWDFINSKRLKYYNNQQLPMKQSISQNMDNFTTQTDTHANVKPTIVFCDLHKLLVYIRKQQQSNHDYIIRAKTNGIAVKFYISIRRNLLQALEKLGNHFELVIYSSLDQDMGDAIIDFIESSLNKGKKLFSQRFHVNHCTTAHLHDFDLGEVRQRDIKVLLGQGSSNNLISKLKQRQSKSIIFVSSNLKEVSNNLMNVVPVKSYDGRRSKNATLINLANYLIDRFTSVDDIRECVVEDFIELSQEYKEYSDQITKYIQTINTDQDYQ